MILLSVLHASPIVSGQNETRTESEDPAIKDAQTARELLNHTLAEYEKGNISGAEELATTAYLDNFEHVESPLIKKKSADLKDELEDLMRIDLRNMIKDKVPFEQLNSYVNTTDSKLVKAIRILNDTVT